MVNKLLAKTALEDKFRDLLFHAIVNEAFLNAIPIKKEEISPQEKTLLTRYSYNIVKGLGGIPALEKAIDLDNKSLEQNLFLADIYNLCNNIAKEAAGRVVSETDWTDPKTDLKTVVNSATLTEKEFNKFAKNADNMKLDDVSDIIKQKTVAVLKDEQEQYQKEEDLNAELKESLAASENFSDFSNDAYLDIFIDKTAPRHHISVFSKLQETAMEAMDVCKVHNDWDYFPIVNKVTFESLLKDFKVEQNIDFETAMENMKAISNEEVCTIPHENRPRIATLVSIIIYTILETLKTMNIFCPSQATIKNFVNKPVDTVTIANADKNEIITKVNNLINECSMEDYSKMDTHVLANQLAKSKQVSELAQEMLIQDVSDKKLVDMVTRLDENIAAMENVLHEKDRLNKEKALATEGFYDNLDRSRDIAQFNKISNMYGVNPLVSEIILKVNPNTISSVIDVECANESHHIIKKSFINISTACEASEYLNYLTELYQRSKLSNCGKKASILINDGKGTKIPLS